MSHYIYIIYILYIYNERYPSLFRGENFLFSSGRTESKKWPCLGSGQYDSLPYLFITRGVGPLERPILMSRMPVVDDDYRNDPSVRCQSSSASMLRRRRRRTSPYPLGVVRTSNRIGRTSAVVVSLPEMVTRTVLQTTKSSATLEYFLRRSLIPFDSIPFYLSRRSGRQHTVNRSVASLSTVVLSLASLGGCCRSLVSSVSSQNSRRRGLRHEPTDTEPTVPYRTVVPPIVSERTCHARRAHSASSTTVNAN